MDFLLAVILSSCCFLALEGQFLPSNGDLRLMGGTKPTEGRVEIFTKDHWGTMTVSRDLKGAAQTVCKQLGYFLATDSDGGNPYGTVRDLSFEPAASDVLLLLKNVRCRYSSSEGNALKHIFRCDYDQGSLPPSDHRDDFAVKCATTSPDPSYTPYDTQVRLVQSFTGYSSSGYLEVYLYGSWGPVCHLGFFDTASACRQLGYNNAGINYEGSDYAGNGTNKLNIFNCNNILEGSYPCLRSCFNYPPDDYTPSCTDHSVISCTYYTDSLFSDLTSGSQALCSPSSNAVGVAVGVVVAMLLIVAGIAVCVVLGCLFLPGCFLHEYRQNRRRRRPEGPAYANIQTE